MTMNLKLFWKFLFQKAAALWNNDKIEINRNPTIKNIINTVINNEKEKVVTLRKTSMKEINFDDFYLDDNRKEDEIASKDAQMELDNLISKAKTFKINS